MWDTGNKNLIKRVEKDWGIQLPIKIEGIEFTDHDQILFTLKTEIDGELVFTKTFDHISENTISLSLTEEETNMLTVRDYAYSLDWYQDGAFLCNIIPTAIFRVVNKT